MSRLVRNKKILRQAEERAKKKTLYLANEIEASSEFKPFQDYPAADTGTIISPAVQSSLGFLNKAIAGFSSSSVVPIRS